MYYMRINKNLVHQVGDQTKVTYTKLQAVHIVFYGWATSIRLIRKHQRDTSKTFFQFKTWIKAIYTNF